MAALATPANGGLVWQKVAKALAGANPDTKEAFRALKNYFSQQKKNPDLNLAFWAQADAVVAATGTVLGTGTATIYGIYAKKGTVATASYLKIGDDATGSLPATYKYVLPFIAASQEKAVIDSSGLAISLGISVHNTTTATGATSSTGATTCTDGFVLYGA